jgi:hypothetical protein
MEGDNADCRKVYSEHSVDFIIDPQKPHEPAGNSKMKRWRYKYG